MKLVRNLKYTKIDVYQTASDFNPSPAELLKWTCPLSILKLSIINIDKNMKVASQTYRAILVAKVYHFCFQQDKD